LLQLQFKEINLWKTPLGADEVAGLARQINNIARIKVNACVFEGSSFPRLCQKIQQCNVEVNITTFAFQITTFAFPTRSKVEIVFPFHIGNLCILCCT